jgi:hypothetical protein
MRRSEIAAGLGYRNIAKGLRRLDSWIDGSAPPPDDKRAALAELLGLEDDALLEILASDRNAIGAKKRAKRATNPHYLLTIRIMAAVYSTKRLPLGITRREAIRMAGDAAKTMKRLCALNTPESQTLWFGTDGKVYHLSDDVPTMRIGGREVTFNLF